MRIWSAPRLVALSAPLVIGGSIVLVVLFKTIAGVIKSVARERTRREIAAFIAEGSMTPDQGERLMQAGRWGPER